MHRTWTWNGHRAGPAAASMCLTATHRPARRGAGANGGWERWFSLAGACQACRWEPANMRQEKTHVLCSGLLTGTVSSRGCLDGDRICLEQAAAFSPLPSAAHGNETRSWHLVTVGEHGRGARKPCTFLAQFVCLLASPSQIWDQIAIKYSSLSTTWCVPAPVYSDHDSSPAMIVPHVPACGCVPSCERGP